MAGLSDILGCQRQLASTLARMLDLARARQWAQLPALDARCTAIVGRLQGMEADDARVPESAPVLALARRIRDGQDDLTRMVRPQFVDLMRRIDQLRREQELALPGLPHDRMRGREQPHDAEKCSPGGARGSAGGHPH